MATEWRTAKLSELVAFKTGKLDSNAAVPDGDYPFFTCSQETLRTNTYSFDTECVLLAGNNANGIYPLKYFHGKFDAYQRTYVVKPRDPDILTTKFLYYSLRPKLSELRSFSTGAATKFLTLTILNETEIEVPPASGATADSGHPVGLRRADGEQSAAHPALGGDGPRPLPRVVRPLPLPRPRKAPARRLPLGDIPQGWEVKKLGDIAEDMRRNVQKGELNEPKPYVGLEHIPRHSLALDAWETAKSLGSNKLEFKKGEVLFGKIRPYFHKVSVAPFDGLCSADTIIIRVRRPEEYAFVLACVSSDEFVAHASATANGAKMPEQIGVCLRNTSL